MFSHFIQKAGIWWMLPILLLAWVGVSLSIERLWYWMRLLQRQRRSQEQLTGLFQGDSPSHETAGRLGRGPARRDPTLVTLSVFLVNLLVERIPLEIAETRARDRAQLAASDSRRFLTVLGFIANLAGTLGLLGTVAGVSMSFEHLANKNPTGLALSLSTAMYTTIGGIFLFLLTYLAVSVFTGLSERLEDRMDTHLTRLKERCQLADDPEPVLAQEA